MIISDPLSGAPVLVSFKADQRVTAAAMNPGREFRLGESGRMNPNLTTPNESRAPSVRHCAMFPSGGGGGGGGGGDDGTMDIISTQTGTEIYSFSHPIQLLLLHDQSDIKKTRCT